MKVIQFGVGGVGSWCAEALVRAGISELTIVDPDNVAESNINRQLIATYSTVGRGKVEVLKERLLDINPKAEIVAIQERYDESTAGKYNFSDYDYVIDAIDSLADKMLLILNACDSSATLISSMGAAGKVDPQAVRVAEFWKVKTCPLARSLRQRFKKSGMFPSKKFLAVYSEELSKEKLDEVNGQQSTVNGQESTVNGIPATKLTLKPFVQVTATFGMNIAAIVIKQHCCS